MKAIEPPERSCEDCLALQHEEGDPRMRCEAHTVEGPPEYEKTTLGEWGAQLPIGVLKGADEQAVLGKSFAFREFHFEREREIDKLRNKPGGAGNHPGKVVTTALAYMLTEWGGEPWPDAKQQKLREAAIISANMEDVLYAWVYFRVSELDPVLAFKTKCPIRACQHEHIWKGDLRSIEVTVTRKPLPQMPFTLSRPLRWMKEDYDTLLLQPPKWAAMTQLKNSGTIADIKAELALSAVHSLAKSDDPEAPFVSMGTRALDYLHKLDIERLTRFVVESFPQVDSSFEIECPECRHTHETSLDWTWDFLFGSSSLSTTLTV